MKNLNAFLKGINMNKFSVRVIWNHVNASTKMDSLRKTESDECLNIFGLNIRSLPKHGSELLHFLKDFNTKFDVIILNAIGSENISIVDKLIPYYHFHDVLPTKTNVPELGFTPVIHWPMFL